MKLALSMVSNDIDKREGSIIFDALAPTMYQIAQLYLNLENVKREAYIQTTHTNYLDMRVEEQGLYRFKATKSIRRGEFKYSDGTMADKIPIGYRFSTIVQDNPVEYRIIKNIGNGLYDLECATEGTIGNFYKGNLIPIDYIDTLEYALLKEVVIPGRDEETDEDLKLRYFETIRRHPFGGNIAQYKEEVLKISGVGGVQVYPTWNGGGTVKLSVVDTEYKPITEEFKGVLGERIDPENYKGKGFGIAPIGHHVTIDTPEELTIDIYGELVVSNGYDLEVIKAQAKTELEKYFEDLKKMWDKGDVVNQYFIDIYLAKINSILFNVPGIINIKNTTINNESSDLKLEQSSERQTLPKLGELNFVSAN